MEAESPVKETILITGGSGYFGFRLGCALSKKGVGVILFDVSEPIQAMPDGVRFVQGDVRVASEVEEALRGVSCIFHTASFGMSGREQLNWKRIEDVNVKGTENVIEACRRTGVPRLVYTSTYNVVFGGQVIENGDESLPYLPLHLHPDHYSRTKAVAEMKVLEANGTLPGALRTCALRPAGIYGPGERRHLPRIVNYIERGWFQFVYGDPSSLVDFVHVDNLVEAHILAAEALRATKEHKAGGQAYYISDGRPVNNFEFFRPLVESLGYTFPTLRLPLSVVYFFAFLTEMVHFVVRRLYNFQPLLTRTEVYKTGVTHYFSLGKARRELGYEPQQYNLEEVVEWFKSQGHGQKLGRYTIKHWFRDAVIVVLFAVLVLSWFPKAVRASSGETKY
ncbi:short-chain dehydrogenase/reductase family 42E member 1 isoform X2 [Hemicordylus capensis]|uniref:short-chain dehydrogenase/reductase family 42E member 1 isoform X2 n=1 Tax=Hemicordylus capensis TaxID=884348 RepID=UPI002303185C|nr:short-chain dehydrogenase/reductase family 42E member 1 isoform X2 [Hemicordylus capensis]XP_053126412.1 short-chain dehydrogenase/reductase family 42E member 1 isoform X2 [Hemicordylus capensis]XP_053126413.1 short-chain dehydrogenase/reductase family 42E member 1 isoform X2 [Hemicordylus capensis]